MYRFSLTFFSLLFYFAVFPIFAQNAIEDNQVYGLNPLLYNGKVYNYFPKADVKGHQYFEQKNFIEGSITIRGNKYDNVLLNYDILNQEIILKYIDPQGSNRLLTASKAWLEEFSLGDEQFSLIETPEAKKLIIQTLNQGPMQLHLFWTKRIIAEISLVAEYYVFEKKRLTMYLSYKGDFQEYKSTKDIFALMDKNDLEKVKRYIRQHKIKSRTSSLDKLHGLLVFCNQLGL